MKSLKKFTLVGLAALTLTGSLTSCATVFGGRITENQKRRPAPGEQRRQVRAGALIADILLFPLISIPVDLATGAMYKPQGKATAQQTPTHQTATTQKK